MPLPAPGSSPAKPSVRFVRHPRARRYVLRIRPDRVICVTIPRGGTERHAREFLASRHAWVEAQLARLPTPTPYAPWQPGLRIWYRGEPLPLLETTHGLQLGDQAIALPDRAPVHDWRPHVEAHLRELATHELPPLVLAAAAHWNLPVRRVSIRNQRTRWGSCSRRGTISLNWHLIQTPAQVRDYLIAHELAHLREMNHSPRFWKVVDSMFPNWREAESWLKRHGRQVLHPAPP